VVVVERGLTKDGARGAEFSAHLEPITSHLHSVIVVLSLGDHQFATLHDCSRDVGRMVLTFVK